MQSSQFAGTPMQHPLDLSGSTLYCGDCTEVGAPEVDGLLIGTRFGGGQSGSRTREPPPRCFFCCRAIRSRIARHRCRLDRGRFRRNLTLECERAQIAPFSDFRHLTGRIARPRFPCAPRTEHRRLMAPRSALASAKVNREAGRRGKPARCIFCGPTAAPPTCSMRDRAVDIGCPGCAASSPSSAPSCFSTPCCSAP